MVALKDVVGLFHKCHRLYEVLQDKHQLLVAQVESISNMIERLPALSNPDLYRILSSDTSLHVSVSRAQLKVLESTWQGARETLIGVQQHLDQLKRRDAELQALIRRSQLSQAAMNKKLGAEPSINDLASAIHNLYDMLQQQVRVEAVLLEKLSYTSPPPELQATVGFFKEMPHVDSTEFEMMAAQVRDSTELK
eukprot:jgi/Ulvmu1/5005/UM021_0022.1